MLTFTARSTSMDKATSDHQQDQQWLENIKSGNGKALEALYRHYRDDFLAFAQRYGASQEDLLDVYQDAIIVLFENVKSGKITELSSSVKTYLFSIGKYKLIDRLRQKGRNMSTEDIGQLEGLGENVMEEQLELTHRQQQLRRAINILGGQCKTLLLLFYYRRYSIEAIRQEMDYKNDNVVKAHKSRCMKSLRKIIDDLDIL